MEKEWKSQVASLVYEGINEELQCMPVYLQKPKKRRYTERWLLLWQTSSEGLGVSIEEQAISGRLTATDYRVRDFIMCRVGIGNFVHFSQTEAAQILGIKQPNISKSLKKLIKMGIVLEGPKSGKFKTYQINPAMVFAGSLSNGIREKRQIIKDNIIPLAKRTDT